MDLPNEEASSIVKQTLEVDEELYADVIKREITIKGKSFKL